MILGKRLADTRRCYAMAQCLSIYYNKLAFGEFFGMSMHKKLIFFCTGR